MAKKVDISKGFKFRIFQKWPKMPILAQNSQIIPPPPLDPTKCSEMTTSHQYLLHIYFN